MFNIIGLLIMFSIPHVAIVPHAAPSAPVIPILTVAPPVIAPLQTTTTTTVHSSPPSVPSTAPQTTTVTSCIVTVGISIVYEGSCPQSNITAAADGGTVSQKSDSVTYAPEAPSADLSPTLCLVTTPFSPPAIEICVEAAAYAMFPNTTVTPIPGS